jgi:hypothetical protein
MLSWTTTAYAAIAAASIGFAACQPCHATRLEQDAPRLARLAWSDDADGAASASPLAVPVSAQRADTPSSHTAPPLH